MNEEVKAATRAQIEFEVANGPWFGPIIRAMRAHKDAKRKEAPLSPEAFVQYLGDTYPETASAIEWVRFHLKPRKARKLPIAVCHIRPIFRHRQFLFDNRNAICAATGWYPLTMGRRLKDRRNRPLPKIRRLRTLWHLANSLRLGELNDIRARIKGTDGTSILLDFQQGSLLLDFGFECEFENMPPPKLAVLTHAHADHAGGIRGALAAGVPVLLSESVYWQLIDRGELPPSERDLCFPVTLPCTLHMGDRIDMKLIAGAHTPGAMMVRLTTPREQLLYPGDYCLRNAFYQRHPADLLGHFAEPRKRWLLLLDGTFLGYNLKDHHLSTLKELEKEIRSLHEAGKSVAFFAQSADYLYTLYIWLFRNFYAHRTRSGQRWLVVDERLQDLLDSTFADIYFRRHKRRDPFVTTILGGSDANYVETVRLYQIEDKRLPANLPPPFDVFCSGAQTQDVARQIGPDAHFYSVGHQKPAFEAMCAKAAAGRPYTRLDGCDFAFHSSPDDVARIVTSAATKQVTPIIFHNDEQRIRHALREKGVDDRCYECLKPPQ